MQHETEAENIARNSERRMGVPHPARISPFYPDYLQSSYEIISTTQ